MTITDCFLAGYSSFINDRIFHVSGDVVLATDLHALKLSYVQEEPALSFRYFL